MTSYRKAIEAMEDEVGQLLEDVAVTRAIEGYQAAALLAGEADQRQKRPVVYEIVYNNQLLALVLKRLRPKL
jgi:hypothetical protein